MASSKITNLTSLTAASGDEIPVNRSGSDGKITAGDIAALVGDSYVDFVEIGAPSNPSANTARLFCRDNGSGKTQLCVIFSTGSVINIVTEE